MDIRIFGSPRMQILQTSSADYSQTIHKFFANLKIRYETQI